VDLYSAYHLRKPPNTTQYSVKQNIYTASLYSSEISQAAR